MTLLAYNQMTYDGNGYYLAVDAIAFVGLVAFFYYLSQKK